MKWLACQGQISAVPPDWRRSRGRIEGREGCQCALSQSTIRAQKAQGLKSVGGSQSRKRGHLPAFGLPGLSLTGAITAFGQLAPSFSVGLKLGRSFRGGLGGGGAGRGLPGGSENA